MQTFNTMAEFTTMIVHELMNTTTITAKPLFTIEIRFAESITEEVYPDDTIFNVASISFRTFSGKRYVVKQIDSAEAIAIRYKDLTENLEFIGDLFEYFDYDANEWRVSDTEENPISTDIIVVTAEPSFYIIGNLKMIKNKPNEKLNIKNNILNNTKNIMICIFIRYIAILA